MDKFLLVYAAINFPVYLLMIAFAFCIFEKRRPRFAARLIAACTAAILGVCCFSLFPRYAVVYALKYIFCFFCTCACLCICFEISCKRALCYGVCAYAVQHIAQNMFMLLFYTVNFPLLQTDLVRTIAEFGLNFLGFLATALFLRRYMRKSFKDFADQLPALPLCALLVSTTILWIFNFQVTEPLAKLAMELYAILVCVVVLYSMYKAAQINQTIAEKKVLQQLLLKQEKQYKISKQNVDMINIRVHDFKKQIQLLIGKTDNAKIEELKNCVSVYENKVETGNETLDVLLTEFAMRCTQEQVRFTYMVDGEKLNFMSTMDICSIFYNMLENALESVQMLEPSDRIISLKVFAVGNMVRISSYNTSGNARPQFETAKPDPENHGFGLKSMAMTVRQHGGEMKYALEDNVFSVDILLPIGAAQEV